MSNVTARKVLREVLAELRMRDRGFSLHIERIESILNDDDEWDDTKQFTVQVNQPALAPEAPKSNWEARLGQFGKGVFGALALAGAAKAAYDAWRAGKGMP
jgi:hypothetical protein